MNGLEIIIKDTFDGITIKEFLKEELGFSRRLLKNMKEMDTAITVNGSRRGIWEQLAVGDILHITFPAEQKAPYLVPEDMALPIVYEDDAVLVIDKPAGIATIPSMNQPTGTIANGIRGYYEKKNLPYTVHIATRLDRDTSGLMLIAKHRYSHAILSEMQKSKKVDRQYLAIITGGMQQERGTISAPIGRKEGSIIERAVVSSGQRAVTHYQVLKKGEDMSLLKIHLETGRTHQIRVHFSAKGHPLIGDDLYGGSTEMLQRQALHSASLTFTHPLTREWMQFTSKLPDDMAQCLMRADKTINPQKM